TNPDRSSIGHPSLIVSLPRPLLKQSAIVRRGRMHGSWRPTAKIVYALGQLAESPFPEEHHSQYKRADPPLRAEPVRHAFDLNSSCGSVHASSLRCWSSFVCSSIVQSFDHGL